MIYISATTGAIVLFLYLKMTEVTSRTVDEEEVFGSLTADQPNRRTQSGGTNLTFA